ncbi:MAG TPA: hypothetical protein VM452_04615 [Caulifigura sp.]|nr:hypothetical protein [Caulifigura sp.]
MRVSSRTPEGESGFCRVCGKPFLLEMSAAGDVPCPRCGSLNWPDIPAAELVQEELPGFYDGVDVAPAFLHIRPSLEGVPVAIEFPAPDVGFGEYWCGKLLRPFLGRWSRRRRDRDREQLFRLLLQVSWCATRADVEKLLGPPRLVCVGEGNLRQELYGPEAGNVVLQYRNELLCTISGIIPFSSLEWGAGLEPGRDWQQLLPTTAS